MANIAFIYRSISIFPLLGFSRPSLFLPGCAGKPPNLLLQFFMLSLFKAILILFVLLPGRKISLLHLNICAIDT